MRLDFLISSERSGSNLITKLIDTHSLYIGPSPVHLIRSFALSMPKYGSLSNNKNWDTFIVDIYDFFNFKIGIWNSSFSFDELLDINDRSLEGVINYLYAKEAKSFNKNYVFVKEVKTYLFYDFIKKKFNNAKFIWLIRDPRDVASSWSKSPVHRGDIVRGSNVWKEDQLKTMSLYKELIHSNQILLVKYEDLITNQAEVTKSICSFLEVEYEPTMINFHQNKLASKNAIQTDNWKNLNRKIITTNHKKYLKSLSKKQIQYIEYLCREEMKYFDYKNEYPIITEIEFNKLSDALNKEERFEKKEYQLIDAKEKQKREIWQRKFFEITSK
ncbi:sulfotransferase [Vicingus serpentipes]|uniref:Sulfotransferase n=1 Tax=Vicingus serpentipes TaxID=1926625 RepID=A0A5C6RMX2_9FLAO|nr:sulfotransferase [Vicingus serpentipes]TXB63701.1 sulfotransferase [Vicingus serpentipes]